ncbi:hypothetical protein CCACVL1_08118 [Corchorus capsularis]|uniref:Uncharacterized protein n=1 Tax=Corchorus capsularis TaxID=210143 RepID=A0A1R3J252_COCAP|nr:hypothetical protein CCACVL1_08118 [Corchorus capsularis]
MAGFGLSTGASEQRDGGAGLLGRGVGRVRELLE